MKLKFSFYAHKCNCGTSWMIAVDFDSICHCSAVTAFP